MVFLLKFIICQIIYLYVFDLQIIIQIFHRITFCLIQEFISLKSDHKQIIAMLAQGSKALNRFHNHWPG